ncbi:hypothetical protein AB0F17_43120 [Nonomuraea sp. NPDC026600]|uniref:DUF7167 family protein n=1 Tax=Nonomuraea sp. NPDC026600 TaxID=3155363 RepID=UPI0033CD75B0
MTLSDTVKLHVTLRTDLVRSKISDTIDTQVLVTDWDAMTEQERQEHGDARYHDWMLAQVEGGWTIAQ